MHQVHVAALMTHKIAVVSGSGSSQQNLRKPEKIVVFAN
jgi:hypothetical protein